MKQHPIEHGRTYHFFNRGNNKENLFREAENYRYFLQLIIKYLAPIADIYSYCLLPNHYHMVFRIKEAHQISDERLIGKSPSQSISNLFNAYSKAFNKKYGRSGSLFQVQPKRVPIESTDHLRKAILYVNVNAHHHGIDDYRTYPHSSYMALISKSRTQIDREVVVELFQNLENFKFMMASKAVKIDLKDFD